MRIKGPCPSVASGPSIMTIPKNSWGVKSEGVWKAKPPSALRYSSPRFTLYLSWSGWSVGAETSCVSIGVRSSGLTLGDDSVISSMDSFSTAPSSVLPLIKLHARVAAVNAKIATRIKKRWGFIAFSFCVKNLLFGYHTTGYGTQKTRYASVPGIWVSVFKLLSLFAGR